MKLRQSLLVFSTFLALSGGVLFTSQFPASAATGTVPTDLQTAIDDAVASTKALSPLALACLAVALIPLGSMLTLRFINMVLSRV
jgi:predicted transcriptional regulator